MIFNMSGIRTILLLIAFWFYAFRAPVSAFGEGVFSSVIMGPFQTELDCQKARLAHQAFLDSEMSELKIEISPCAARKGVEL